MKELSVEEKAKRYDKKLDVARHIYADPSVKEEDKYYIEVIFPELTESDDERIRRQTLKVLNYYKDEEKSEGRMPTEIDECIAWLEKQGEQKPYGQRQECVDCQFNYAGECKGSCVMKRGEQKLVIKVEPKFKVKYANSEYNVLEIKEIAGVTYYGIEDEPNHIDYVLPENCEIISGYGIKENGSLYPTKPAKFSEQNPAWSEEDERIKQDIENLIHFALKDGSAVSPAADTTKEDALVWLKFLRPQNRWKPSDEQIEYLAAAVEESNENLVLDSLYQDLKRLRKE